jgi:ABC-type multidrug transport system ATPase subunit
VERELDRFGLSPDEHPLDVSPAETRKLAIGSLLAMDPDVLVLDEPTNGLDELASRELCALLTEVNRQGTALLVISHDVELACEFATRVIVMNDGRIIIDDEPRLAMTKTELLKEAFVEPPPVVRLSHALSKGGAPALSVEELADWLTPTGEAAHDAAGGEPLSPPKQSR